MEKLKAPSTPALEHFGRFFGPRDQADTFATQALAVFEQLAAGEPLYDEFQIPKGTGKRTIHAPKAPLKSVLRQITWQLNKATISPRAFGFAPGRSPYKGIQKLLRIVDEGGVGLDGVFETDITDFFPSITEERASEEIYHFLWRMLHRHKEGPQISEHVVREIANFVGHLCSHQGALIQGAPTSPALSNMVGKAFDKRIMEEIDQDHFVYGRYADDIVVLGLDEMSKEEQELVLNILRQCGFNPKTSKTKYRRQQDHYQIWQTHVFPENDQGRKLHFRLPKKTAEAYARELLQLTQTAGLPEKADEFMNHPDVLQVMGYLSHAYNVTSHGMGASDKHPYYLPDCVVFAWEKFLDRFSDRLPPSAGNWFRAYKMKIKDAPEIKTIPLTVEAFKDRQKIYCEKQGLTYTTFRKRVISYKKRVEAMEEAYQADSANNDMPEFAVQQTLEMWDEAKIKEEFEKDPTELGENETSFTEQMQNTITLMVAFTELMLEGKITSSEKEEHQALPEELQYSWDEREPNPNHPAPDQDRFLYQGFKWKVYQHASWEVLKGAPQLFEPATKTIPPKPKREYTKKPDQSNAGNPHLTVYPHNKSL